jgi:lipid-binding SYLF domain-containing protein
MKRILMILLALAISTQFVFAGDKEEKEEKEEVFDKKELGRCDEAKAAFLENDEEMTGWFKKSHAYVIYDNVAKGAIGIGGAHGNGIVYQGGQPIGTSSVSQVTIGLQLGGQEYMEVIFFENAESFENFTNGNLKLSGQASAVAATHGASADAAYQEGMAIFTIAKGGLMYEASVGGQKFDFERKVGEEKKVKEEKGSKEEVKDGDEGDKD